MTGAEFIVGALGVIFAASVVGITVEALFAPLVDEHGNTVGPSRWDEWRESHR